MNLTYLVEVSLPRFGFAENRIAVRVEILQLSVRRGQNRLKQQLKLIHGGFRVLIIVVFGEAAAQEFFRLVAETISRRRGEVVAREILFGQLLQIELNRARISHVDDSDVVKRAAKVRDIFLEICAFVRRVRQNFVRVFVDDFFDKRLGVILEQNRIVGQVNFGVVAQFKPETFAEKFPRRAVEAQFHQGFGVVKRVH